MSFWSQQAKFKALKDKKVSKKTQNSFMTAYHVLRDKNIADDKARQGAVENGTENGISPQGSPEED